jgi:hypothetical protein
MRSRFGLGAAATAMVALLGGGLGFVATTKSVSQSEARTLYPAPPTPAKATVKTQSAVPKSTTLAARQAALHIKRNRALSALKNRGPGERAHRRWRKRRSAGRA